MTKSNYRTNIIEIFFLVFYDTINNISYRTKILQVMKDALYVYFYEFCLRVFIISQRFFNYIIKLIGRGKLSTNIYILWKCFYSLAPIFVVSTKCIDPWVLEFMVSNTTGNNQWENCISFDFNFRGLSGPRNPQKLEPHD
jgi:hypothetical protein